MIDIQWSVWPVQYLSIQLILSIAKSLLRGIQLLWSDQMVPPASHLRNHSHNNKIIGYYTKSFSRFLHHVHTFFHVIYISYNEVRIVGSSNLIDCWNTHDWGVMTWLHLYMYRSVHRWWVDTCVYHCSKQVVHVVSRNLRETGC